MSDLSICEACDGRGWIPNEAVMENPQLEEPDSFKCTACNGEGFIDTKE